MLRRSARAALVAVTALLLAAPTAAVADDSDRRHRGHDRDLPTSYLLDPNGQADPLIFPEGIAVRGDTFYVGSTQDGTIYRGELDEEVATPFLLPGNPEGRTFAVGMTIDKRTLYVAGGPTGQVFAYDLRSRELVGQWSVPNPPDPENPDDPATATFLNDLAISDDGDVYITDSVRPVLFRIDGDDRRTDEVETLESFVDFTGTALRYTEGFNLNGIVVSRDDRYLVVAQSNTATLFRIGIRDTSVRPIDLGGSRSAATGSCSTDAPSSPSTVAPSWTIDLDRRLTRARREPTTDATFVDPTTAARVDDSLLVVNSQFSRRPSGQVEPFRVTRIPVP